MMGAMGAMARAAPIAPPRPSTSARRGVGSVNLRTSFRFQALQTGEAARVQTLAASGAVSGARAT